MTNGWDETKQIIPSEIGLNGFAVIFSAPSDAALLDVKIDLDVVNGATIN